MCNLCLAEKLEIIKADKKRLLNKRTELVSKCRHENRFYLCNFPPAVPWTGSPTFFLIFPIFRRSVFADFSNFRIFPAISNLADFSILSNLSNYFRPFLILPMFFEFFDFLPVFPVYNNALFIVFWRFFWWFFMIFYGFPFFPLQSQLHACPLRLPPIFPPSTYPLTSANFSAPKLYFVQSPFLPGPSGPHFYPRFWVLTPEDRLKLLAVKLGVVPWIHKVVSVFTQLYLSRGYWAPFFFLLGDTAIY